MVNYCNWVCVASSGACFVLGSNFQTRISDMTKIIQASAQSSYFTTEFEVENPTITKRWGKNSFKDCTDKYDCAVECGMGTDQC